MKYMVNSQERLDNSPLYSIHTDLDSFILYNDENINEQVTKNEQTIEQEEEIEGQQPKYFSQT